jgi:lysophospholipase L1-like esterase
MRYLTFSTLLLCAALHATVAFSQSLSIINQSKTNAVVNAMAPASPSYVLQASANLHLWVDLRDQFQGLYSYQFDGSDVSQRYFRLKPSEEPPGNVRLMLLGDSMTSDCCGWGGGIYDYFKPNVTVINYAQAWVSTKVFLRSAEMDKMLVIKPKYVLIQYGYMDSSYDAQTAPDTFTSLPEFEANLRSIVAAVRSFNGTPILVTLHAPRQWDTNNHVISYQVYNDRNDITKKLAAELNTPLIDLFKLSEALFNKLGPSCYGWMHKEGFDPNDYLHMSHLGALWVSQLVAGALPDELGSSLTGIFTPPPQP